MNTINALPSDLRRLIYSRLPTRGLLAGRRVCRLWRNEISAHDHSWIRQAGVDFATFSRRKYRSMLIHDNDFAREDLPFKLTTLSCQKLGGEKLVGISLFGIMTYHPLDGLRSSKTLNYLRQASPNLTEIHQNGLLAVPEKIEFNYLHRFEWKTMEEGYIWTLQENNIAVWDLNTFQCVFFQPNSFELSECNSFRNSIGYTTKSMDLELWDFKEKRLLFADRSKEFSFHVNFNEHYYCRIAHTTLNLYVYNIATGALIWKLEGGVHDFEMNKDIIFIYREPDHDRLSGYRMIDGQQIYSVTYPLANHMRVFDGYTFLSTPHMVEVRKLENYERQYHLLHTEEIIDICHFENRVILFSRGPNHGWTLKFWDRTTQKLLKRYELNYERWELMKVYDHLLYFVSGKRRGKGTYLHVFDCMTMERLTKPSGVAAHQHLVTSSGRVFAKNTLGLWSIYCFDRRAPSFLDEFTRICPKTIM